MGSTQSNVTNNNPFESQYTKKWMIENKIDCRHKMIDLRIGTEIFEKIKNFNGRRVAEFSSETSNIRPFHLHLEMDEKTKFDHCHTYILASKTIIKYLRINTSDYK